MTKNLFSRLKKYSSSIISQDENYATETLAMLLEEFPSFRSQLVLTLFGQEIEPEAEVRTQVGYDTKSHGRAILDLLIEDSTHFIVVEVKIEAGLNYYDDSTGDESNQVTCDQISKYEDCKDMPSSKTILIFTLSKYPLNLIDSGYRYFEPTSNQLLWRTLFKEVTNYYRTLTSETPEKYMLGKFLQYLKEENMAGFEHFRLSDIANLSQRIEVNAVCTDHRSLIYDNITIHGFKPKHQTAYNRDGVIYEWTHDRDIKIFLGLWLSDEGYYFKFPRELGPQVMVFLEMPPKHKLKSSLLSSQEITRVSKDFHLKKDGFQIILRRKPLIEFISAADQGKSLLDFYTESISELQQSGLLKLLKS